MQFIIQKMAVSAALTLEAARLACRSREAGSADKYCNSVPNRLYEAKLLTI